MRPAADADRPLTRRPQGGHAPRTTDPRRPVRCCWRSRPPRAPTTRASPPPRHAGRPGGRRHQPHAGARAPGEHARARPAAVPADDVVRHAPDRRRHRRTPPSRPTQRQIKVVYAYAQRPARRLRRSGATRCRPTSRASSSSSPLQTGGRRALRFDMGTECGPQYVDIQVVHAARARSAYSPATTRELLRRGRRRARPPSAPSRPARRVRPGRRPHRRLRHEASGASREVIRRRPRPAPATSTTTAA